jgi:hypothetical protein
VRSGIDKGLDEADVLALAQMLLTETDLRLTPSEMQQIVQVALNRARSRGVRPRDVVTPPGFPKVWNTGPVYRQRFLAAAWRPELAQAKAFVRETVASAPNHGYTGFAHPRGMPQPVGGMCERSELTPMKTVAGVRCMPQWLVKGTDIGSTRFA